MKGVLLSILTQFFLLSFAFAQEKNTSYTITNTGDTAKILETIKTATALVNVAADSSIGLLQPALQQSKDIGFERGIANALVQLGLAYTAKGEMDKSLSYYLKAMPYVQKHNDKELITTLYTGIGTPLLRKGDYTQASAYYYKALQIVNTNGLQNSAVAAHLYLGLCNLWWTLRRYDYALKYILQSEQISVSRKDSVYLISVYGNLSTLYYSRNEIEKSDDYAQLALALAEKKHVVKAEQLLLANIGASLREQGKAAASIPYFKKAISLADDDHAYQHNLQPYYNLACAYYQTGDYKKANKYALYYLNQSEKLDMDKEHTGDAMRVIAGVYEKEGNYKEADKWWNKYTDFTENILTKEADSSINKLEDNYRISEKDKQIAQKQLLLSKKEIEIKSKNIWIGSITGCIIILSMLLFILFRVNRHKQYVQKMKIRNLTQEKELGYLKAMMDGEEKERARLARELHDGIGGMLVSAKMNLGSIRENHTEIANINELDEVMRLLNATASEIRHTAHNLMPDALIKNSLQDALLLYCADINTSNQLDIDIQFHGQLAEMSKSVELIFYRITQELIQNIVKHSGATQAVIQIIQDKGRLNLIVEDNGVGFNQEEISKGYGLQNLQFRVQALQGYISVTSTEGKGTSVYIEFDLEKLKNA